MEASNELENNNPFSFKNFVKKDAALKTGGRVLQVRLLSPRLQGYFQALFYYRYTVVNTFHNLIFLNLMSH